MIDDSFLDKIDEIGNPLNIQEDKLNPVETLVALGRKHGYVTTADVLNLFPTAEQEVEQLEEAFAALINAEIPYIDEDVEGEPSDDDLEAEEADDDVTDSQTLAHEDNYLANIDTR